MVRLICKSQFPVHVMGHAMIFSMVRLFRIISIFAFGLLNVLSYDDAGVAIYQGVLNTTAVVILQGPPAYDAVPDVIDASFNKTYSGVINTTEEAIYKFSYREIKNRVRVYRKDYFLLHQFKHRGGSRPINLSSIIE